MSDLREVEVVLVVVSVEGIEGGAICERIAAACFCEMGHGWEEAEIGTGWRE